MRESVSLELKSPCCMSNGCSGSFVINSATPEGVHCKTTSLVVNPFGLVSITRLVTRQVTRVTRRVTRLVTRSLA